MADQSIEHGPVQPQGMREDPLLHYPRLLVKFLQMVFGSFPVGDYRWEEDREKTEIFISLDGTYALTENEGRPQIVVRRGGFRFANLSIDQFKGHDSATGRVTHTDLSQGAVTYNCIAREGLEAQRIAWACSHFTRSLKRSLMRAGFHQIGETVDIGEEEPAQKSFPDVAAGSVLVRVFVPFFFQDTWSVEPIDKLLLTKLETTLRSEREVPVDSGPLLKRPAYGGRVLHDYETISLTQRVTAKK